MSSHTFSYTADQSLPIPDAGEMRFGIITTEWNNHITDKLLSGAIDELTAQGVDKSNITTKRVPGSFELVYAAQGLSAVLQFHIAIGISFCQGVTQGIAQLNATSNIPVIFGLLTVNNEEQAEERAGGKLGNKGREFALTAIKMVDYAWKLQK